MWLCQKLEMADNMKNLAVLPLLAIVLLQLKPGLAITNDDLAALSRQACQLPIVFPMNDHGPSMGLKCSHNARRTRSTDSQDHVNGDITDEVDDDADDIESQSQGPDHLSLWQHGVGLIPGYHFPSKYSNPSGKGRNDQSVKRAEPYVKSLTFDVMHLAEDMQNIVARLRQAYGVWCVSEADRLNIEVGITHILPQSTDFKKYGTVLHTCILMSELVCWLDQVIQEETRQEMTVHLQNFDELKAIERPMRSLECKMYKLLSAIKVPTGQEHFNFNYPSISAELHGRDRRSHYWKIYSLLREIERLMQYVVSSTEPLFPTTQ